MARQGDDIAIDTQVAFRKLAKTLNTLLARLENAGNAISVFQLPV